MPTKQLIIIIAVLCVIALGLGYWVGLPKEVPGKASSQNPKGAAITKEPEFLRQGLVAYYPFNGNAKDATANNYHGFLEGHHPPIPAWAGLSFSYRIGITGWFWVGVLTKLTRPALAV
ncbi:MAG: hypothetical protein CMO74_02945 [Verrucomicrobiales bacterium]|nr:hypothetical protein [Verrucomicrobiales bacterium]